VVAQLQLSRATVVLALVLAVTGACGPADGTRRALTSKWPGGETRLVTEEVRHDGAWVKDGPARFSYADGTLEAEGEFRLGFEVGPWTQVFEDGTRAEGEFKDGQRNGLWTYYHQDGSTQEQGHYVDGEREGEWIWWYPNGDVHGTAMYVGGKKHGTVTEYDADGELIAERSGFFEYGLKIRD